MSAAAMILAAGRGTRLADLGLRVPKALVEVHGEPLLARQLGYLERQGFTRVVVNAHYRAEQIVEFARTYRGAASVKVLVERNLLGTAGGVRNALPLLGAGPILVLYGDVIVDAQLAPMLEHHHAMRSACTLAVYESTEILGKGLVQARADNLITAFVEKGSARASANALVSAGIYVAEPELIYQTVAEGSVSDFGHDVFPAALERGARLHVYRLPGPVLDVGTPQSLRVANGLNAL